MATSRAKAAQKTDVAEVPEALGNAVTTNSRPFSDDVLKSTTSFEDAMKLVAATFGGVADIDELELGNGYRVATDEEKGRLVGTPFLILSFAFNEGNFGEFASITLMTTHGDRMILNDGSTGIYAQLLDVVKTSGRTGGIFVKRGLRKSEYATCRECGKPRKPSESECGTCGDESTNRATGVTYYLDVT